ncbi:MAG: hypothetical protein ACK2UP_05655, partial [Candidatus Promineifilaceae bacterium]
MKSSKFIYRFSRVWIILVLIIMAVGLAQPNYGVQADPVAVPGSLVEAQELGAVRFKGLTTVNIASVYEIMLGNGGLASSYITETDVLWANGSNLVSFVYDAANDKLTAQVTNANGTYATEYLSFSTQLAAEKFGGDTAAALEQLSVSNYIQWSVTYTRSPNATVAFRDVALDGNDPLLPVIDFSSRG